MVKITSLSLLFFIFFLNSACQQVDPEIIRFGIPTPPKQLDPRLATDAVSSRINRLLYQRLVDFNAQLKAVPSLATWQKISPLQYRFTLKQPFSLFTNGQPLTTEDVKATYLSILDKKTASPHRSSIAMIKKIKIIDTKTLDFILTQADPQFPSYLVMGILPKKQLKSAHSFTDKPLGSGYFEFLKRFANSEILIKRRQDQQKFQFIIDRNPTVRVLKLQKGEIDLLQNNLPPEMIAYLNKQPHLNLTKGAGSNFTYLGFQLEDPIAGNLLIRKAIAHAINRPLILEYLLAGRVAGSIFPPEHWLGMDLKGLDYNPELARQYLKQAGISTLKITYKTSNDPFRIRIATVIQNQLKAVGIEVKIQSYDWGTFFGDIKNGRFQMYSLTWVGIKSPDIFHYIYHSDSKPPKGANRGRFSSKEVDQLIEQGKLLTDSEQQKAVYQELQQKIFNQLVYIPLWYEDNYFAARNNISGYQLALDGNYDALFYTYKQ